MNREEIFALMNRNPAFALATSENNIPKVRYVLMFRADEDGILFHTSPIKALYGQLESNPNAELCFYDPETNTQVRVSGTFEQVDDLALKEEIVNHPTRAFLREFRDSGALPDFYNNLKVFRLKNGQAVAWTMETNFAPKTIVEL